MIGMALLLLAQTTSASPTLNPMLDYKACVSREAKSFASAGETVEETFAAAKLACSDERATYAFALMEQQKDAAEMTADEKARRRESVLKIVDELLEQEVVPMLFRLRSGTH